MNLQKQRIYRGFSGEYSQTEQKELNQRVLSLDLASGPSWSFSESQGSAGEMVQSSQYSARETCMYMSVLLYNFDF